MGNVPPSPLKDFGPNSLSRDGDFDANRFQIALHNWCEPYRWACSPPFLVGWYNEKRRETAQSAQLIKADEDCVGYALYSVPGFLDTVAQYYRKHHPETDYVDATTKEILNRLRMALPNDLVSEVYMNKVVNTDAGPQYYHVQTIGCVAGLDEHIEVSQLDDEGGWKKDLSDKLQQSRDQKMWGSDPATLRKIFGVNVHPVWGGWYGYRALVVLKNAKAPRMRRPEPLRFLDPPDAKRIITEFNLRHAECRWRDLEENNHNPRTRYTTSEFFYFTETDPRKRLRYLELRASELDTLEREGMKARSQAP